MVKESRIFLHRLIDLEKGFERPDHKIRLTVEARSDLEWWFQFAGPWNGVSILETLVLKPPDLTITSDTSGSWGCGAFWGTHWFQLKWAGVLTKVHISIKELIPIVLAVALWGSHWRGKSVQVLSDNTAAVAAINNKNPGMGHFLHSLAFMLAHFQCQLSARHIAGEHNTIADALSHDKKVLFHSLHPQADQMSAAISLELLYLLLLEQLDWTSFCWTELWNDIFHRD